MSVPGTRQGGPRHLHSPRVRRLAAENGVDLGTVTGSGPHGRATQADVLRAAAPATTRARPAPSHVQIIEVDLTRLSDRGNLSLGITGSSLQVRPLTVFAAKAALEALQVYPQLGGQTAKGVGTDITLAVDTQAGQRWQVLADAGSLNLAGLERRLADLAVRTRSGQSDAAELTPGSFTLRDNICPGLLIDVPVLESGQLAVLSAGSPAQRPVVVGGTGLDAAIAIRLTAYLTLVFDESVIGPAQAAGFLGAVKAKLEAAQFR